MKLADSLENFLERVIGGTDDYLEDNYPALSLPYNLLIVIILLPVFAIVVFVILPLAIIRDLFRLVRDLILGRIKK